MHGTNRLPASAPINSGEQKGIVLEKKLLQDRLWALKLATQVPMPHIFTGTLVLNQGRVSSWVLGILLTVVTIVFVSVANRPHLDYVSFGYQKDPRNHSYIVLRIVYLTGKYKRRYQQHTHVYISNFSMYRYKFWNISFVTI